MIKRGDTVLPKIKGGAYRWPMLVIEISKPHEAPCAICFWISAQGAPHFVELAPDLLELYGSPA